LLEAANDALCVSSDRLVCKVHTKLSTSMLS
jgi:hypothetical protein